jgi:FkbM family methyltransferase
MWKRFRNAIQKILILVLRPYVSRELPGWGKLFFLSYRWDWLWRDAPVKKIHDKRYGHSIEVDLSTWSDRSYYFLGRWYDLEIQLLVDDLIKPGETVVDVGANRGSFALAASYVVGDGGKVICFEPNPNCIKTLENETERNEIGNIFIHRCGLSDEDNMLTLSVPFINSGEGSFAPSQYKHNLEFSAPVCRGDDILAMENPSLIKIDVEGFETKVILGISQTISRCSPIVITEVIANHLERAGSSVSELMNAMGRLGYKGYKLGLRKRASRHEWCLSELTNSNSWCDAVWLTPAFTDRMLSEQRIT